MKFTFSCADQEKREKTQTTTNTSQVSLVIKNPPAKTGDIRHLGLIPGSGRSLGGGNGNPLQYSCLEDSMDRGAWRATVQGVTKSRTQMSTQEHHMPWWMLAELNICFFQDTTTWVTISFSESRSVVSNSLRPHGLYSP